jgi:aryl-alcohol dehydrogenase-like predicted oxidoreductase
MLSALGSTGLRVTRIGLGLAALGRPAYINSGRADDLGADRTVSAMERRCHEVLDAAYAAGVRYFDVARSYGLAEAFLSSWLEARRLSPEAATIGSKWGYTYTGDWRLNAAVHEVKDLSLESLQRQLRESRVQLGDHLQLYQIHSATIESAVLEDRRLLAELVRLRSEGLVVGLTVTGPRQSETIRRALAVDVDGENPFRVVQATWNLLEPSSGAALAEAHAAGWGVIAKEVLANGRLTSQSSEELDPPVTSLADELSVGLDQVAIAAALANPWVDVVLSGAVTEDQVRSNVHALDVRLSPVQRQTLAGLAQPADLYWSRRASRPWT